MDKPSSIPNALHDPALSQALWSFVATWAAAAAGRMLWHLQEVQKKRRRFFSLHLLWELATALAIGFFAEGVADYLGFSGKPAVAAVIMISYLGPRGIDELMRRLANKYGIPPKDKTD